MKPKPSQPTGVCCYCVLSESHCNSTSRVSSFFPLCVFSRRVFLFNSFLGINLLFCHSFVFFSNFSTFSYPANPHFHSHVASQPPKGVHICAGKSSNIPLVGFCMCLCFRTKLLWYSEAFHGLFSNFCGALAYQNLSSWERGTQSQPMHMEAVTRAKRQALWFLRSTIPYLETRWGLMSTS